jgi:tetratricopeptide (TPR) repeat protein
MNLLDLAKQHRKAGRLAESAATLQQAVMAAPMDPEVWFQGGTLAIKLKEFAFARTLFEMCARLVPTDAQAIYNVGYCSFRLGDPEAALAAYERAVAIDPGFVRAHIARGQLHYILGHPDEGRDATGVASAVRHFCLLFVRTPTGADVESRYLERRESDASFQRLLKLGDRPIACGLAWSGSEDGTARTTSTARVTT